ncbi:MAG: hypothetical protein HC945_03140 [Nitrosarchaeum sp.]|nr:hypothetical protein [Nitrosarchaeum sp.]
MGDYDLDLQGVLAHVRKAGARQVLLQFPDGLRPQAAEAVRFCVSIRMPGLLCGRGLVLERVMCLCMCVISVLICLWRGVMRVGSCDASYCVMPCTVF